MQIAPKHDFAAKLRQETLFPRVLEYIQWQKAFREAKAVGKSLPDMPRIGLVSLNLDLTTACNYRCTHCIDWDKLNTGVNYVDAELFESLQTLIDEGLRSVILIGGGEPTMHRKFEETVRFLKDRKIKIGIVTNGSRGDVLLKVAPLLAKGDWIRFSLDSGKDDTFSRMHLPVNKRVNLHEICTWVPKIRDANPDLQVGFSFIIVWNNAEREAGALVIPNIDEIVIATKLAREYRFNYISFKPFLVRRPDGAESLDPEVSGDLNRTIEEIVGELRKATEYETNDFKVLESTNLRVLIAGNWREFTRQPKMCHMMAFRQVLSPLGIFHCPAKRGVQNSRVADNNAFTAAGRDEMRISLPVMLSNFDASVECAEITCLYNDANWWLERLINGEDDLTELVALPERGDHYL